MANSKPISTLPLDSIERLCSDAPLVSPGYLDQFDSTDSLRMLFDLLEALRNDIQPCATTVRWFDDSLTKWIRGEGNNMEGAFNLSRQEAKTLRHHIQTVHLRAAFDLIHCEETGLKARAELLADEIRRFEIYVGDPLPEEPLPEWSGVRRCIHRALHFGSLPKSWERLADRCGGDGNGGLRVTA